MATTLYCIDGQRPSYPADFLNPYTHALLEPTSFSAGGTQRNATLKTALGGPAKNLDFASPATIGFYKIARFYSPPLNGAQTIGAQTITAYCHGFEDVATANAEWEVEVFVIKADNTLRGTIWHSNAGFPEMLADTDSETTASGTGTSVAAQDGDRVAVEIYYNKTGGKAEALSRLSYGTAALDTRVVFATSTIAFKSDAYTQTPIVEVIPQSRPNLGGSTYTRFPVAQVQALARGICLAPLVILPTARATGLCSSLLQQVLTLGPRTRGQSYAQVLPGLSASLTARARAQAYSRPAVGQALIILPVARGTAQALVILQQSLVLYPPARGQALTVSLLQQSLSLFPRGSALTRAAALLQQVLLLFPSLPGVGATQPAIGTLLSVAPTASVLPAARGVPSLLFVLVPQADSTALAVPIVLPPPLAAITARVAATASAAAIVQWLAGLSPKAVSSGAVRLQLLQTLLLYPQTDGYASALPFVLKATLLTPRVEAAATSRLMIQQSLSLLPTTVASTRVARIIQQALYLYLSGAASARALIALQQQLLLYPAAQGTARTLLAISQMLLLAPVATSQARFTPILRALMILRPNVRVSTISRPAVGLLIVISPMAGVTARSTPILTGLFSLAPGVVATTLSVPGVGILFTVTPQAVVSAGEIAFFGVLWSITPSGIMVPGASAAVSPSVIYFLQKEMDELSAEVAALRSELIPKAHFQV